MSGCWCHWCNLSPFEWENIHHEKDTLWTIDLMKKCLNDQLNNNNMTANEKKVLINHYYLMLYQSKITFFRYFMLR